MIAARLMDPIETPVIIFAMMMLILLLAPVVMERLKLPSVVGLIGAGVIFGPNFIGLIERDSTFQLMGAVGLLYILFNAGLEIDLAGFRKARAKSMFFGTVSFAIPQLVGAWVIFNMGLLGDGWPAAILLASMFGSHTLLAYPVASRLGLTKNEAVTVTIGGTMVTDVSALLVLAVVAGSVGGDGLGPMFWIKLTAAFALLVALAFAVLPRLASWYFKSQETDGPAAFIFVMASVFTLAWVADITGLQSILGAFLSGVALNRLIPTTSPLMSRIKFMGDALFVPFFLVSVGMLADFSVLLTGWRSWAVSISMCVLVLSTKWVAAMLSGLLFRYSREQRWLMFGLSVPQAAATLAAVMVGYDIGLFDDAVLNGTIIMILVTCLVGPYVVEKEGRALAVRETERPPSASDAPQRLLVPLANPDNAGALMDVALLMRDALSDQAVFPLIVAVDGDGVEERLAAGETVLSHAVVHAAAANIPTTPITRVDMNITAAILRAVKETRISHVVVGWDGKRSGSSIFGRVLDPLVTEGRSAVFICHLPGPVQTCNRVLLAVPPWSERGPGFDDLVRDLKLMTQRLSAQLVVVVPEEDVQRMERRFKRLKPDVPTTFKGIGTWGGLLPALADQRGEDDLLVLLSARKGTIAWEPGLDRLPGEIARRFPSAPAVVAYPSEMAEDRTLDAEPIERADNLLLHLDATDHDAALRGIVEALGLPDDKRVDEVHKRLCDSLKHHSHEVVPGVVLLDLHGKSVPVGRSVLAVAPEGVTFPKATQLVDTILVLFSGPKRAAPAHLKDLARTAAILRSPQLVAQLRRARSADAFNAVLAADPTQPQAPRPSLPDGGRVDVRPPTAEVAVPSAGASAVSVPAEGEDT